MPPGPARRPPVEVRQGEYVGHARVEVQRARLGRIDFAVDVEPPETAVGQRGRPPEREQPASFGPAPWRGPWFTHDLPSCHAGPARPIPSGSAGPGERSGGAAPRAGSSMRWRSLSTAMRPSPAGSWSTTVTAGDRAAAMRKVAEPDHGDIGAARPLQGQDERHRARDVRGEDGGGSVRRLQALHQLSGGFVGRLGRHADEIGAVVQSGLGHRRPVALQPAAGGRDREWRHRGRPPAGDRGWRDA